MISPYFEFYNPVKILSGKKALENIPFELKQMDAHRPILLTNSMLTQIGLTGTLMRALAESDVTVAAVFEEVPPDSSIHVVNEAGRIYRREECDSIIALGGGSVIDTAKGLSILISQETDDVMQFMGYEILKAGKHVPFVVIPTTAGTGSEATLVAVIANPEAHVKMEFISYKLLPDVAVLDPRMTASLPPRMTASTGMDALVHAVEAYTCIQKNPLSDAYAVAALNLIRKYLPTAVRDGRNEEARMAMANAALMAGVSFSNSMVGLVHAIGHACGGVSRVPHGDAMTVLLPHCMEYNMDAIAGLYGELLLPLAGPEEYARTPQAERPAKTVDVLRGLIGMLHDVSGLPTTLSQAGAKQEDLEAVARTAVNDGAILMNPKEAGYEDVMGILKRAL